MRSFSTVLMVSVLIGSLFLITGAVPDSAGEETLTGSFKDVTASPLRTSGQFDDIEVGDFDGDGNPDLVFSGHTRQSPRSPGLYAYRGDGKGNWTTTSSGLPNYDSWGGITMGDADGDGNMELYACDDGWGWYNGTINGLGAWEYSSGTWSTSGISSPQTSGRLNDVFLGNFTKGSGLDIAITHSTGTTNGIKVFYGSGSSPITWTSNSNGLPTSWEFAGIDIRDLNNDSLPDIAAVHYGGYGLRVYTQDSNGNGWTDRSSSLSGKGTAVTSISVVIGDCNNDGHQDILIGTRDNGMKMVLGNSGGTSGTSFSWTNPTNGFPSNYGTSGRFSQLQLRDIDGDGDLDLLAAEDGSGLMLFLGNGSKKPGSAFGWTKLTDKGLPTSGGYYGANFIDYDKDGDLDIAGGMWGGGMKVYRSNLTVVKDENSPPMPKAGANVTIHIGETVTLNGTGSSDPEDAPSGDITGSNLTYDWNITRVPAGSSVNDSFLLPHDGNATVRFTPDAEGTYLINLSVRDTSGSWSNRSDEDSVKVTVINDPPIPVAPDNVSVYLGANVTLNGTESYDTEDAPLGDFTGKNLTYDWNVTSYPPQSLVRDISLGPAENSSSIWFVPDKVGRYVLNLSVRDRYGKHSHRSNESSVTVDVIKPNERPYADAGVDKTRFVGMNVTLNGSRSRDPDGEIVLFNWTCTSHTVQLGDPEGARPFFTPETKGIYRFTLGVKDSNDTWSLREDTVNITAVEQGQNLPPSADAGEDMEVFVDELVVLDGSASEDIDGTIVEWNWTCITHDHYELANPNSSNPSFTPNVTGSHVFTLGVKDDNETWSHEDSVRITVKEVYRNRRPVAVTGDNITAETGDRVQLDGTASYDPDGVVDGYNWTCLSHSVQLADDDGPEPWFQPEEAGIYGFSLSVQDNEGDWSLEAFTYVNVTERNLPPVAVTSGDLFGIVGQEVRLDGNGSYDDDGSVLHFNWTCTTHQVVLEYPDSATPAFVPDTGGIYLFELTVQDDDGYWSLPSGQRVDVILPLPENVTPTVGPFLYSDGSPVSDGEVRLEGEGAGVAFEVLTDESGTALFDMGIPPGTYRCSLWDPDNGTVLVPDFEIVVDENGSVTYPPEGIPAVELEPEEPQNSPPINAVISSPNTTIKEGESVTLTAHAFDPDGDPLIYTWRIDKDNRTHKGSTWTVAGLGAGQYRFTVSVWDGSNEPVEANFYLTVEPFEEDPPPDENGEKGISPLLVVGILVLVLAAGVILFLVLRGGKEEGPGEDKIETDEMGLEPPTPGDEVIGDDLSAALDDAGEGQGEREEEVPEGPSPDREPDIRISPQEILPAGESDEDAGVPEGLEPGMAPPSLSEEEPVGGGMACEVCGEELQFSENFNRYYCPTCERYV